MINVYINLYNSIKNFAKNNKILAFLFSRPVIVLFDDDKNNFSKILENFLESSFFIFKDDSTPLKYLLEYSLLEFSL